jgi:tetracycline repressor-like protein
MWRIVDSAVERGELRPTHLPKRVQRLPLDLVRNEAITYGTPIPADAVEAMVDDVYIPLLKGLTSD